MKAMLMNAPGGPEVLQLSEVPKPELPSPSHLLVRLHAAGINPLDTKIRKSHMYYPDKLPALLGCDGAGVVEEAGKSVRRFKPGDQVYFFNGGLGLEPGNYAEFTAIHEDYVAAKPKNLSMIEAAAAPLVLITAWEALVDRIKLEAGETILIHAGAGGVGHVAVQIARNLGARIATTVSGGGKTAFVKSLGAELAIPYKKEDFVKATRDWTGGKGADVVFDTVGGATFCQSFSACRLYGRIVTLLTTPCEMEPLNKARLRNLIIGYVQMTAPLYLGVHEARCAQTRILEQGARIIEEGKLKINISQVFPLDQAAQAHRQLEDGHATGKVVLEIA